MTVEIIESTIHRVHDICLGNHFMTGVTVIEQSNNFLLRDRGQVYEGSDDAGGFYIDCQDIIL